MILRQNLQPKGVLAKRVGALMQYSLKSIKAFEENIDTRVREWMAALTTISDRKAIDFAQWAELVEALLYVFWNTCPWEADFVSNP